VARAGAGPKAALLDRAARAGLPVPAGVVVPDQAVRVADGLPPEHLAAALGLLGGRGPVAVRSAFSAEDGAAESMAGRFRSVLGVDAGDPAALGAAIAAVLASGAGVARRDVLIMRMVRARTAGVAFSERDHQDDLVNWAPGLADRLVGGAEPGRRLELARIERLERPTARAGWARRLQRLLRAVRRALGPGDWDVEWADDGRRCWLVQARPVTRPTRRNEAFTIANHKEILPPLPSRLMATLIASSSPDLLGWFRAFDADLPAGRPLVEVVQGRPMMNLSLLEDLARTWGLPTRLVTDSLGGAADRPVGLRPVRVVAKAPVLARLGLAQARAAGASRRAAREMLARTADPGATFGAVLATLRWQHVALVHEMSALTGAMSAPVALLRRAGTLQEHAARQRTAATAMLDDLAAVRAAPAGTPARAAAWRGWLARHGHRGVYESDVARPRFREDPAPVLAILDAPPRPAPPAPPRTLRGRLTLPLWWQAGAAMRGRERLRADAMVGFERIRLRLLALARAAAADGRLPEPAAVWDLSVDEAAALDGGWVLTPQALAARRAEIAALAAEPVPDLVRRFDPPAPAARAGTGPLAGIGLTAGRAEGRAWVLQEPDTRPPAGFRPEATVLVARAIDPGWVPVFALVAGVVVETGGDLSHGSIVLRELGIPAVTNVAGATARIRTGDRVRVLAGAGRVELPPAA
jgi:pyruvate,water dikinase